MTAKAALAIRLALLRGGYTPIPLYGKTPPVYGKNNKRAGLGQWQRLANVSYDQIEMWGKSWPDAINTGILTKLTPVLDADILDEAAAIAVEDLVREFYEEAGRVLVRIGKPPKRAFLFRTEEPFAKLTVNLAARNGAAEKLEFLAADQQVVVAGIHPDTGKPYRWFGGDLTSIPREELPYIREQEACDLIERAADLLVADFGYARAAQRPRKSAPKGNGSAEDSGGSADWQYLIDRIRNGESFHDSLRDLAAKLVASGMEAGAVVNFLRAQMDASSMPHDQRWQDRRDDIPRLVESAVEKFPRVRREASPATQNRRRSKRPPRNSPTKRWRYYSPHVTPMICDMSRRGISGCATTASAGNSKRRCEPSTTRARSAVNSLHNATRKAPRKPSPAPSPSPPW
jgi:hypothetical protein